MESTRPQSLAQLSSSLPRSTETIRPATRSGGSHGKRRKDQLISADEDLHELNRTSMPMLTTHHAAHDVLAVPTTAHTDSGMPPPTAHTRSRSKRLSRGMSTSQQQAYSGLEVPLTGDEAETAALSTSQQRSRHTRTISALEDISNNKPITRVQKTKLAVQTTTTTVTLVPQQRRRSHHRQAASVIPSPIQIGSLAYLASSSLDDSFDSTTDSLMDDVDSQSQDTGADHPLPPALSIEEEEDCIALNASLDSTTSVRSFRVGLNQLRIHHDDVPSSVRSTRSRPSLANESSAFLDTTVASNFSVDSVGSANQSFSSAFSAMHADANVSMLDHSTISYADDSDLPISAADLRLESSGISIPTESPVEAAISRQQNMMPKHSRTSSSTPAVLPSAASTLTVSMAHSSLAAASIATAVAPSQFAQLSLVPAATAVSSSVPVLPNPPALLAVAPVAASTTYVFPGAPGPAMNAWSAHLLGAAAVAAAAAPVVPAAQPLIPADVPLEEYNASILESMLEQETKYLPNPFYMEQVQTDLSFEMRSILVDWLVEVAEEYSLGSQTLFLSVNYLDRFLSVYPVDRAKLQLLGVTCLLLASKYWEAGPPSIQDFLYISDATYTREQVLEMEGALLNTLKFGLTVITPWDCSTRIGSQMGRDILPQKTEFLAEMMQEQFMLDSHYLQYRPSVIAVSALFLALYTTDSNPWPAELETACNLSVESIQLCVRAMHAAYLRMLQTSASPTAGAHHGPLIAIREKFQTDRYACVADIPPRLM